MELPALLERLRGVAQSRCADSPTGLEAEDRRFLEALAAAIEDESGGSGGPTIRRLASEVRP